MSVESSLRVIPGPELHIHVKFQLCPVSSFDVEGNEHPKTNFRVYNIIYDLKKKKLPPVSNIKIGEIYHCIYSSNCNTINY